jgi:hypothetical protein
MFPLASLMPLMFSISLARRIVVAAAILLPVLPGTLYKITGFVVDEAIALLCW